MGSFSISHWLIVVIVIFLLFGGKKIPELAKGIGQGIKDFKKAIQEKEEVYASNEATQISIHSEKNSK